MSDSEQHLKVYLAAVRAGASTPAGIRLRSGLSERNRINVQRLAQSRGLVAYSDQRGWFIPSDEEPTQEEPTEEEPTEEEPTEEEPTEEEPTQEEPTQEEPAPEEPTQEVTKICPLCGTVGPVASDFGYRQVGGKQRPQSYCRGCRNTAAKAKAAKDKAAKAALVEN